ncbi:hypothetical protein GIB67_006165 [Kingdonia uniflora]|uniref:Glycosyltransferase n=1 Tax=Kingdonia uniflora TaxID=39325 RepID=A0A7J7LPV9_9MAGN|nr:hypothetical protein GIB67_006165 [Kingdonia uniflora]
MSSVVVEKPHALCVTFPSQGHITPMTQLAKLLHSRGFHITFVNTEVIHRRLLRSSGPDALKALPDFRFETIPDGLPHSDQDDTEDFLAICYSTKRNCLAPLIDLVGRLNSTSDVPNVTCIVSDGLMSFGVQAAEKLGLPEVQLWTASACSFMCYLHYRELIKRGITPLKDESYLSNGYLDTPVNWIPGLRNIRLKDIPSFIQTTDPNDIMLDFMGEEAQNCLNAPAIIFNTFDDLEHEVLDEVARKFPNIYTIGPVPLLSQHVPDSDLKSIRSSLWKEDSDCLQWLDKQGQNSVFYANFGSLTVMTEEQLLEFAWGLANSKHLFLWIVRPDAVMGESATLPKEFLEETKDRGLISTWCAQDQVLLHPSVGAFLTHCGWNSILETISGGVPIVSWASFADQQTNARYATANWEIGMEIDGNVQRENIEGIVRELMEGEGGKKMRKNASEWRKKAEEATKERGSSYNNFDRVIKEVLLAKTRFDVTRQSGRLPHPNCAL